MLVSKSESIHSASPFIVAGTELSRSNKQIHESIIIASFHGTIITIIYKKNNNYDLDMT